MSSSDSSAATITSNASSPRSSKTDAGTQDDPCVPKTTAIIESFGGWDDFMASFGLKPWDDDDVEDAYRIAASMAKDESHEEEEEGEREESQGEQQQAEKNGENADEL